MSKVIQFPSDSTRRPSLQRVKSTYTVREISEQFGLSETYIRRWTREGFIEAARAETGELRYDFRALKQFRRVRELRAQGLSPKQIDAELRGQLNLFPGPEGRLIRLPIRLSPFEEALLLHEATMTERRRDIRKRSRRGTASRTRGATWESGLLKRAG